MGAIDQSHWDQLGKDDLQAISDNNINKMSPLALAVISNDSTMFDQAKSLMGHQAWEKQHPVESAVQGAADTMQAHPNVTGAVLGGIGGLAAGAAGGPVTAATEAASGAAMGAAMGPGANLIDSAYASMSPETRKRLESIPLSFLGIGGPSISVGEILRNASRSFQATKDVINQGSSKASEEISSVAGDTAGKIASAPLAIASGAADMLPTSLGQAGMLAAGSAAGAAGRSVAKGLSDVKAAKAAANASALEADVSSAQVAANLREMHDSMPDMVDHTGISHKLSADYLDPELKAVRDRVNSAIEKSNNPEKDAGAAEMANKELEDSKSLARRPHESFRDYIERLSQRLPDSEYSGDLLEMAGLKGKGGPVADVPSDFSRDPQTGARVRKGQQYASDTVSRSPKSSPEYEGPRVVDRTTGGVRSDVQVDPLTGGVIFDGPSEEGPVANVPSDAVSRSPMAHPGSDVQFENNKEISRMPSTGSEGDVMGDTSAYPGVAKTRPKTNVAIGEEASHPRQMVIDPTTGGIRAEGDMETGPRIPLDDKRVAQKSLLAELVKQDTDALPDQQRTGVRQPTVGQELGAHALSVATSKPLSDTKTFLANLDKMSMPDETAALRSEYESAVPGIKDNSYRKILGDTRPITESDFATRRSVVDEVLQKMRDGTASVSDMFYGQKAAGEISRNTKFDANSRAAYDGYRQSIIKEMPAQLKDLNNRYHLNEVRKSMSDVFPQNKNRTPNALRSIIMAKLIGGGMLDMLSSESRVSGMSKIGAGLMMSPRVASGAISSVAGAAGASAPAAIGSELLTGSQAGMAGAKREEVK